MEKLLQLDPKNKRAQDMLTQARKELGQAKKKGHRVQIEEVEEDEGENGKEESDGFFAAPPTKPGLESTPPKPVPQDPPPIDVAMATIPIPENVKTWKEKGNDLFRRGQYAEAVDMYSKAVDKLEKGIFHVCGWVG